MRSFRSTALLSFLKRISALQLGLPMAILLVTVGLATGGSQSARAQPEIAQEAFSLPLKDAQFFTRYTHGGTSELCFVGSHDWAVGAEELFCYEGSSFRQVSDIRPGPAGGISGAGFPGFEVHDIGSGKKLFFSANDGIHGNELYVYDGSGVTRVADIHTGSGNSNPSYFATYDDGSGKKLFFNAYTSSTGDELYVYNGSSVSLVEDAVSGADGLDPRNLTVYDGKLYFRGSSPSKGIELYTYDGSSVNLVKDINSGSSDGRPEEFAVYDDGSGSKLYFRADDGNAGQELFAYDGSSVNLVEDINSGSGDSIPSDLTVYDDGTGAELFFNANDGTHGAELMAYDGSSVRLVEDINGTSAGSFPFDLTVYNEGSGAKLYFNATDNPNASDALGAGGARSGQELYVYDGSNIRLVKDINSGSDGAIPSELTVYKETLYFMAYDGVVETLHAYDGSSVSQPQFGNNVSEGPEEKIVFQGKLYFRARSAEAGQELFVYNGSEVTLVEDLNPGRADAEPRHFAIYDDGSGSKLYFQADDGSVGRELFAYDGSSIGRVKDINAGGPDAEPRHLTVYDHGSGPKLYFSANDGSTGRELFVYDGSGVSLAADINSGSDGSNPNQLTVYGGELYFGADNGSNGGELYSYDGSSASLVKEIRPGSLGSYPGSFTVYDDGSGKTLFFAANDGTHGDELFSYDGSSVQLVKNIAADGQGFTSSSPRDFAIYDDGSGETLYFSADDGGANGRELFVYDGSSASLVQDINSGSLGSSPRDLAVYNGRLYFVATNGSDGYEPHSYNGSQVQTVDLNSGPVGGGGLYPVVYNDGSGEKLYVTATDGQTGMELYRFDRHNAPLPVELTAFDATKTGRSAVELTWQTASEQNNAGFEVQHRSVKPSRRDGSTASPAETARAWEKIGFVEGGGTTSDPESVRDYRFTAEGLAVGTHRFRLKQVDLDGTTRLHDPVTVEVKMEKALRLSVPAPNPVSSTATVRFAVREKTEARMVLYNVLGQEVRTLYRGQPTAGQSQTVRLEVGSVPSGVYFLRLQADGQTKTRRLTIVK